MTYKFIKTVGIKVIDMLDSMFSMIVI